MLLRQSVQMFERKLRRQNGVPAPNCPIAKFVDAKMIRHITYKLSQDHTEVFCSVIRSRREFTNNPTTVQFKGGYKRFLSHAEISTSFSANCITTDIDEYTDTILLLIYVEDVTEYVSGFASRKLARKIICTRCADIFFSSVLLYCRGLTWQMDNQPCNQQGGFRFYWNKSMSYITQ